MRKSEFVSLLEEMEKKAFDLFFGKLQKAGLTEDEAKQIANSICSSLRQDHQRLLDLLEPLWPDLMTPQEKLDEVRDSSLLLAKKLKLI
jgi:hypothetical protein